MNREKALHKLEAVKARLERDIAMLDKMLGPHSFVGPLNPLGQTEHARSDLLSALRHIETAIRATGAT
jgi:hypothetical protein